MADALPVRLDGRIVGELLPGGSFRWADGWDRIGALNSPVLSHSLPFGVPGRDPKPFFGGLLPEGIGLDRLAREAGLASNDLHGLLAEVGADVGGSVTIGEPRPPLDPVVIEEEEYDRILARAAGYLRGVTVGGGGSAATGVQPKIALTFDASSGKWMIGRGSTPSTHLLKPVPREHRERLEAEHSLNTIARAMGLSTHATRVEAAGDRDVLVIERYDRVRRADGRVDRIHQEDAAQALGLPWGGNDKYENVNARSSLRGIAALLDRGRSLFAAEPSDRLRLLELTVLNVVAGNTDAHAKNFSLLLPSIDDLRTGGGPRVRLASAYDIVPQALFDAEPSPLAMRIGGQGIAGAVTAADLIGEARSWGVPESAAEQTVTRALTSIAGAVAALCGGNADERLPRYLLEQTQNLLRGDRAWTRRLPPALTRPE